MGRTPCCEKVGLKKGPWTPEEDQKLLAYIEQHGHGSWRALPSKAGLQRCGKSCRLRWTNYLRPDIKRGKFSLQEEQTIIQLHALLGNRWSAIATHLPKRTDNEIKNYWNTHIKKRLTKMGIDPVTHRRKISALGFDPAKNAANLSHMAQWENARLEAEARLVREAASKLVSIPNQLLLENNSAQLVNRSSTLIMRPQPLCLDVLKAWQGIMRSKLLINGGGTSTLESPTSTLNFSENPIVGNQCMSMHVNYVSGANIDHQGGMMIMEQDIQDHDSAENLQTNMVVPQMTKEKMDNSSVELQLQDMAPYPNNVFPIIMEGFTNLVDNTNTNTNTNNVAENCGTVDIEEIWSSILNSLTNSSSLGSPVPF